MPSVGQYNLNNQSSKRNPSQSLKHTSPDLDREYQSQQAPLLIPNTSIFSSQFQTNPHTTNQSPRIYHDKVSMKRLSNEPITLEELQRRMNLKTHSRKNSQTKLLRNSSSQVFIQENQSYSQMQIHKSQINTARDQNHSKLTSNQDQMHEKGYNSHRRSVTELDFKANEDSLNAIENHQPNDLQLHQNEYIGQYMIDFQDQEQQQLDYNLSNAQLNHDQNDEISNLGGCQECFKETLSRIQNERTVITREINLNIKGLKRKQSLKQSMVDQNNKKLIMRRNSQDILSTTDQKLTGSFNSNKSHNIMDQTYFKKILNPTSLAQKQLPDPVKVLKSSQSMRRLSQYHSGQMIGNHLVAPIAQINLPLNPKKVGQQQKQNQGETQCTTQSDTNNSFRELLNMSIKKHSRKPSSSNNLEEFAIQDDSQKDLKLQNFPKLSADLNTNNINNIFAKYETQSRQGSSEKLRQSQEGSKIQQIANKYATSKQTINHTDQSSSITMFEDSNIQRQAYKNQVKNRSKRLSMGDLNRVPSLNPSLAQNKTLLGSNKPLKTSRVVQKQQFQQKIPSSQQLLLKNSKQNISTSSSIFSTNETSIRNMSKLLLRKNSHQQFQTLNYIQKLQQTKMQQIGQPQQKVNQVQKQATNHQRTKSDLSNLKNQIGLQSAEKIQQNLYEKVYKKLGHDQISHSKQFQSSQNSKAFDNNQNHNLADQLLQQQIQQEIQNLKILEEQDESQNVSSQYDSLNLYSNKNSVDQDLQRQTHTLTNLNMHFSESKLQPSCYSTNNPQYNNSNQKHQLVQNQLIDQTHNSGFDHNYVYEGDFESTESPIMKGGFTIQQVDQDYNYHNNQVLSQNMEQVEQPYMLNSSHSKLSLKQNISQFNNNRLTNGKDANYINQGFQDNSSNPQNINELIRMSQNEQNLLRIQEEVEDEELLNNNQDYENNNVIFFDANENIIHITNGGKSQNNLLSQPTDRNQNQIYSDQYQVQSQYQSNNLSERQNQINSNNLSDNTTRQYFYSHSSNSLNNQSRNKRDNLNEDIHTCSSDECLKTGEVTLENPQSFQLQQQSFTSNQNGQFYIPPNFDYNDLNIRREINQYLRQIPGSKNYQNLGSQAVGSFYHQPFNNISNIRETEQEDDNSIEEIHK
eukprot:403374393